MAFVVYVYVICVYDNNTQNNAKLYRKVSMKEFKQNTKKIFDSSKINQERRNKGTKDRKLIAK